VKRILEVSTNEGDKMSTILLILIAILLVSIGVIAIYATNQAKANKLLRESSNQLLPLLSISKDAIVILSKGNEISFINAAMTNMLGIDSHQTTLTDANIPHIYIKGEKMSFQTFIEAYYNQKPDELSYFPQVYKETRKIGKIIADIYLGNIHDIDTHELQLVAVVRDLREVFKEIVSGERDPLTQLPNKNKAYIDFQKLCSMHHLKQEPFALMAVEIDDFVSVQASIGQEEADKSILAIVSSLKHLSATYDFSLYYLNYGRFLLIFPAISSLDALKKITTTVQNRIAQLYKEHKTMAYLTASVGIATSDISGAPTTSLFKKAHKALLLARQAGLGQYRIYKEAKVQHSYDIPTLQRDIQYILEREEMMVYYQPIVNAKTHKIVAAEALMRWKHPKYGMIPPFVFIPLVEQTGFITELGKELIRTVIHQQAKWKLFGFEEIVVSLNASVREIQSNKYVEFIKEVLDEHMVSPSSIKVEITESLAMDNTEEILRYLALLKKAGLRLSLDDFGTGYTSFSYLTKVPASTLKIDKSFVDNILTDPKSAQVVKAIIDVGHALSMDIVAEGVETLKTAQLLAKLQCDYLQGYYFSKPVPAYELQASLLQSNHATSDTGETLRLHDV